MAKAQYFKKSKTCFTCIEYYDGLCMQGTEQSLQGFYRTVSTFKKVERKMFLRDSTPFD